MNIKAIALAYGVPYSMIDSSDQKKAGLDQLLEMMAINCVQPRLTRIQEVLNQQYLPLFDASGELVFCFDDPSPKAPEKEANVINSYVGSGVITVDEARDMLGLGAKPEEDKPEEDKPEEVKGFGAKPEEDKPVEVKPIKPAKANEEE